MKLISCGYGEIAIFLQKHIVLPTSFVFLGIFISTHAIANVTIGAHGVANTRPPLMTERFYLGQVDQNSSNDEGTRSWNKVVLDMEIPGFQPREGGGGYYTECKYLNALTTLRKLKEEHVSSAYLIFWAKNQTKVFAACDGTPESDEPPVQPEGRFLPKRAYSDYLYQLGSWHFYRREYDDALESYKHVEKIKGAPMRPKAAYMVIRSLAYLDKGDAAYDQILKVLSNPSLREVHSIAGNYRFILMTNTKYTDIPHVTPALAKRHLEWLLGIVRIDPEKTANPQQAKADYNDAMEQLNIYFPLYDRESKKIDWWLNEGAETPRMQAVKELSSIVEMVDWMQAKWAYNAIDDDWLWSLHSTQNPYWLQNSHVVEHEVSQWKKSKNGGWLQLAISRVHPSDPLASVLVSKAEAYLKLPWKTETLEYREWLFDLWAHSIRLSLGQGKVDQALSLIVDHRDMTSLLDNVRFNYQYINRYSNSYTAVLSNSLRLLVYSGQIESARTFLNAIQKINGSQSFTQWRTLLATTTEDTMTSGLKHGWYQGAYTSSRLWQEMLNSASSKFMEKLAADDRIPQIDRALISRSLFTRAILLNAEPADIDRVAAVTAKHNPELREDILVATSGHQKIKYVEFLLKHPRFRPAIFLEYAPSQERNMVVDNLDAIDVNNHNDNNWWCRFDEDEFSDRVFNALKILPNYSSILSGSVNENEFEPYLTNQLMLLSEHPYQEFVDDHEVELLKNVPSGPEYLSTYINQWERELPKAISDDERNRRAANLHRAIRTTRYGCHINGSHARYSRESFRLLHNRYEDTPWAKATPYWFGCPVGDCTSENNTP